MKRIAITSLYIVLSIYAVPPAFGGGVNLGASSSQNQQNSGERSLNREKSQNVERSAKSSKGTENRAESQFSRSKSEAKERTRRQERKASESVDISVSTPRLAAAIIAQIESGEGYGIVADLIRRMPVISRPCLPRAYILVNGFVLRRVDCSSVSGPAGKNAPPYIYWNPQMGPEPATKKLLQKIVGSYALRAFLIRAALDDLSQSGAISVPSSSSPEDVLREAIFRHLNDRSLAIRAWRFAGDLIHKSGCRIPTAAHAAQGAVDFNCGPFRVSNIFGPDVSFAGQEWFGGSDFQGRSYAWRQSRTASTALASAESQRNETRNARSQTAARISSKTNTASVGVSSRRSRTLSRSRSAKSETGTTANISASPIK